MLYSASYFERNQILSHIEAMISSTEENEFVQQWPMSLFWPSVYLHFASFFGYGVGVMSNSPKVTQSYGSVTFVLNTFTTT